MFYYLVSILEKIEFGKVKSWISVALSIEFSETSEHRRCPFGAEFAVKDDNLNSSGLILGVFLIFQILIKMFFDHFRIEQVDGAFDVAALEFVGVTGVDDGRVDYTAVAIYFAIPKFNKCRPVNVLNKDVNTDIVVMEYR